MKRILQKIIIKLYWKFQCHRIEPFADQLVLYSMPSKLQKLDMTVVALWYKSKLENDLMESGLISGCVFPEKRIENLLGINEIKPEDIEFDRQKSAK